MKKLIFFTLCLAVLICASPAWPVVQDLGILSYHATADNWGKFLAADGHACRCWMYEGDHSMLFYNLDTQDVQHISTTLIGRSGVRMPASSNRFYITTYDGGWDGGNDFAYYDLTTKTFHYVSRMYIAGSPPSAGDPNGYSDKGVHAIWETPNGTIVVTTTGMGIYQMMINQPWIGRVFTYVPSSGILTDKGMVDLNGATTYKGEWPASGGSYPTNPSAGDYYKCSDAGTMGGITYVKGDYFVYTTTWAKHGSHYGYSMVADDNYAYMGMYANRNPSDPYSKWFYLAIMNLSNSAVTTYWKNTNLTSCVVEMSADGYAYAYVTPSIGGYYKFRLNGTASPVGVNSYTPATTWNHTADTYGPFDFTLFQPDANGNVTLKWQVPSAPGVWKHATVTGVKAYANNIWKASLLHNGDIMFKGAIANTDYGEIYLFHNDDTVTPLGEPVLPNYYSFIYDRFRRKVRMIGYTNAMWEVDLTQPWTLNIDSSNYTVSNPKQQTPPNSGGRYFRQGFIGIDQYFYMMADGEGVGPVCGIGWLNPADNSVGYLDMDSTYAPRALIKCRTGTCGALSTNNVVDASKDGVVMIFDCLSKKKIHQFTPVPGQNYAGYIAEPWTPAQQAADSTKIGRLLGLIEGTPNQIYLLNTYTGALEWGPINVSGKAFGMSYWHDKQLVVGPDGFVWLFIDNNICKINPADGTVTVVVSSQTIGQMIWRGINLYVFNTSDYHVRKYTGLIPRPLPYLILLLN
jgi:hypothetical protein